MKITKIHCYALENHALYLDYHFEYKEKQLFSFYIKRCEIGLDESKMNRNFISFQNHILKKYIGI